MSNINQLLVRWQGSLIKLNSNNDSLLEKKEKMSQIIREIIEHWKEIQSDQLSTTDRTLLITNVILYANKYGVDVQELI